MHSKEHKRIDKGTGYRDLTWKRIFRTGRQNQDFTFLNIWRNDIDKEYRNKDGG